MFFGMLSNAHLDAYTLLVESQELIPSIVLYLCQKVAPIWDESEVVFNDPQAATRYLAVSQRGYRSADAWDAGRCRSSTMRRYFFITWS